MKKTRKIILTILSYVVALALAVAGTIAYLADTDSNVNVFMLSDGVHITMDEAPVELKGDDYEVVAGNRVKENTYKKIYPGAVMPKDPTIHVDEESDDCYLRAKVTVSGGAKWMYLYGNDATSEAVFNALTVQTKGADWTFLSGEVVGEDVVYTLIYTPRMKKGESSAPIFEKIVLPPETTFADYQVIGKEFHVDVIGEAIQAAGFDDAFHAFSVI